MSPARSPESLVAFYRSVLESTQDPLVIIDAEGTILEASRSAGLAFGWEVPDLIGRNIAMLMPEPHRSRHDRYLADFRRTGEAHIIGQPRELVARRRDGSEYPIELTVWQVPLPEGEIPCFTGILRDISDRQALEEERARARERLEALVADRTRALETTHDQLRQADRLATIGTLAAGLGHDMNNVLLPIRCRLDALEAVELPAEVAEHFQAVRSSIDYLQQLTDGLHLLALSPERDGGASGVTDIEEWWPKVQPLFARAVRHEGRLVGEVPDEVPPIAVPPHRLTQAVLNLVVNAGEAIAPGGRVTVRIGACGRDMVRVEVADDGAGMTDEVRRRALDPFYTTKTRGLGTGLGLALVDGMARGAGGQVTIDSAPGAGTRVTIELPAAARRRRVADSVGSDLPRRAALTIADERIAAFARALLSSMGWTTDRVERPDADRHAAWIVDAAGGSIAEARAFAAGTGGIMVLGPEQAEAWDDAGAIVVDSPDDFDAMRRGLGAITRARTPAEEDSR